jgi:hypothetical protein
VAVLAPRRRFVSVALEEDGETEVKPYRNRALLIGQFIAGSVRHPAVLSNRREGVNPLESEFRAINPVNGRVEIRVRVRVKRWAESVVA